MIWIAFVIVKLVELYRHNTVVTKLPVLGPNEYVSNTVWQAGLWLAISLLLFVIEALIRLIAPAFVTGSKRGLPPSTEHQPSPLSTNWEVHFMWPARPILSRNLVFWVTIPPLFFIAVKAAGSKATDYGVVLTVWIALLAVTSLIELETRQALLAYSRGNSTSQTAAPIRFVLAMLFGIASWINAKWFANKKDLGQRNVASQLVDAKLLGLAPRLTMFCIGLLLTLLVLDPGADESAIASRLVLIAILAVGFFLSSPQLTLLAVLGLFTVDQVAPHSSDAAGAAIPKAEIQLAIYLALIILAWTLHSWEQAVRYRRALHAEQQKHKETQTIVAPWGTAS